MERLERVFSVRFAPCFRYSRPSELEARSCSPSSVRGPTFGTAGIPRFPVAPVAVRGGSPGAWDRGVAVVAKPGGRAAAGARGAESCGQLVRVESTGAPVETWVRLMCWKDVLEGPWWTPKKAVFAKFFSFFLHLLLRVLGHQPAHSWTCDQLESASSIDFVPSSLALAGQLDKMFEMFRILTASRLPPFGHLLQPGQCPFPVTAMLFHLPNPLTDTLVMQHADCVPQHAEALGLTLVPIPEAAGPPPPAPPPPGPRRGARRWSTARGASHGSRTVGSPSSPASSLYSGLGMTSWRRLRPRVEGGGVLEAEKEDWFWCPFVDLWKCLIGLSLTVEPRPLSESVVLGGSTSWTSKRVRRTTSSTLEVKGCPLTTTWGSRIMFSHISIRFPLGLEVVGAIPFCVLIGSSALS